jgi:hypothetical protein
MNRPMLSGAAAPCDGHAAKSVSFPGFAVTGGILPTGQLAGPGL